MSQFIVPWPSANCTKHNLPECFSESNRHNYAHINSSGRLKSGCVTQMVTDDEVARKREGIRPLANTKVYKQIILFKQLMLFSNYYLFIGCTRAPESSYFATAG